ncbi:MAG: hypothetical protein WDZ28_03980 [Simkaniaceae bacterium]
MNFTREPIIETIITPKEGYKLLVRNSIGAKEEYSVDALEIVSFGSALFFRSLERPKAFLLPITDFEVIETKESKVVLKNVAIEKSVKIAGGREAPKTPKEVEEKAPLKEKREKRRTRRRKPTSTMPDESKDGEEEVNRVGEGGGLEDETRVSSSRVATLLPPPDKLISERVKKEPAEEIPQRDFLSDQIGENEPVLIPPPSKSIELPPEELSEEREKNQPLLPPFQEKAPEPLIPPRLVMAPEEAADKDDDVF